MGYIEGGSETLLNVMLDRIKALGGHCYLQANVEKVNIQKGKIVGISIDGQEYSYDNVVSTIPLPYVPRLIPDLPPEDMDKIKAIDNIGVVCVLLKLKHKLTENFWLNINDSRMQIPGMIEYSNLNPLQDKVLYVPFYLHQSHPKYQLSNNAFLEEVISYVKLINPEFSEDWIISQQVSRYQYAQPVCPPGFLDTLPPIQSEIEGLWIADTCYYYPEDRSISESMRIGLEISAMIGRDV